MDETIIFSVFEVSAHLRQVIETQIEELYVRGEVSNFVRHRSGHIYFNLKDENATLRCTFFRGMNYKLDFGLEDGQEVVCFGKLTLFEKTGSYNLNVYNVSLSGKGDLNRRFELLKAKLKEEGLFDASHRRPLPRYPEKIGIITSPTGAALQDISNILKRRFPVKVEVFPALVQGSEAVPQLIAGIRYFDSFDDIDLVILTRGGGSQEDLWCFNDESLARAIFASRHPIISAVGHEIDFSIADFVADLRAPTPSAAAELCVPDKTELMGYLKSLFERIRLKTQMGLKAASSGLAELNHEFMRLHPEAKLQKMQQRLDMAETEFEHLSDFTTKKRHSLELATRELFMQGNGITQRIRERLSSLSKNEEPRLNQALHNRLEQLRSAVMQKEEVLKLKSPQELLDRGFAFVWGDKGHIGSVNQVSLGDAIYVRLSDGKLKTQVTGINEE